MSRGEEAPDAGVAARTRPKPIATSGRITGTGSTAITIPSACASYHPERALDFAEAKVWVVSGVGSTARSRSAEGGAASVPNLRDTAPCG
jgi:hypothetical protein